MKNLLKNTICQLGIHIYKPFKRIGEVNWLQFKIEGKKCINCNKEIIK